MRFLSMLLIPALAIAAHVLALLQGRQGGTRIYSLLFWSGLSGLCSLVFLPILALLAGPLPVVGPVNPGFASAFSIVAVLAGALVVSSVGLGSFMAIRRSPQS